MKLRFLSQSPELIDLRPNSPTREWMDKTGDSFAYRCLPLNVANAHGWSFHLPFGFSVHWNGSNMPDGLTIRSQDPVRRLVSSTFGYGIVTFDMHGIFQTEPGWSLLATGPLNHPKSGISALAGVIETDWSPYSFTMNWKLTKPGEWVRFQKGEPFCSVFPVQRGFLESIEPEIVPFESEPELKAEHDRWARSRRQFNEDLQIRGSKAREEQKWQKDYYRGFRPDGTPGPEDHTIKLRLNKFKDGQKTEE